MTPPPLLDDVTERLSNLNMSPSQLQHQMMQMQQMHMQQGQMPHMMQQLAPSIVKSQQLNQMTQAHHQQQHFQQQNMMMQNQVISPLSCLAFHTSTRLPPPPRPSVQPAPKVC
jgi:hypothetical protein